LPVAEENVASAKAPIVPAERRVRQNLGGIAVEQIAPPVLAPHVDRTRKDDSHVTELLHVLVQPPLPHELLSLRVNDQHVVRLERESLGTALEEIWTA
jgi:hypothetical protein